MPPSTSEGILDLFGWEDDVCGPEHPAGSFVKAEEIFTNKQGGFHGHFLAFLTVM